MKKIIKQWRYEIVMIVFVLLLISNVKGWATVTAIQSNYQMCQSNIQEIKDLYNAK